MDSEELKKRTKDFAHRCVKLAMALPDTPLGRHIQYAVNQVRRLRSAPIIVLLVLRNRKRILPLK